MRLAQKLIDISLVLNTIGVLHLNQTLVVEVKPECSVVEIGCDLLLQV
jgi:hypothetical protein